MNLFDIKDDIEYLEKKIRLAFHPDRARRVLRTERLLAWWCALHEAREIYRRRHDDPNKPAEDDYDMPAEARLERIQADMKFTRSEGPSGVRVFLREQDAQWLLEHREVLGRAIDLANGNVDDYKSLLEEREAELEAAKVRISVLEGPKTEPCYHCSVMHGPLWGHAERCPICKGTGRVPKRPSVSR